MELLAELERATTVAEAHRTAMESLSRIGVTHFSIRAGRAGLWPDLLHSTMPPTWVDHYVDRNYLAVDPGPAITQAARNPVTLHYDRSNSAYSWSGRLDDLADDLLQIDVTGCFAVPLTPTGGQDYCMTSFYAAERGRMFDLWLRQWSWHMQSVSALLHYRINKLLRDEATIDLGLQSPRSVLSLREIEVLSWLAAGARVDRIADRIGVSNRTVDFHIANARRKLGARTREQAVAVAVARRLISP